MPKFAGIKNNKIQIVSDERFVNDNFIIIELPQYLSNIDSKELIANYKFKNGKIELKKQSKPVKDLKIAFISNYKMQCGISSYCEFLYEELIQYVGDYKLFIEENETPTGSLNILGNQVISDEKIVTCWKRGQSLKKLAEEVKNYDPDIVLINHEFGLFPNARYFLSLINQLSEFRVIVVMHSVFKHLDKAIVESAMPEIIVHLSGARDVLKDFKGVPGVIHVVPHGCVIEANRGKLWNFYKSNATFMQTGFGFRYKAFENCIKAAGLLKDKYPDVFFTGLFSESPFNKVEHQNYYDELMELVNKLDLQENVAIIRGYQSDVSMDAYLRTNQVAVFPYVSHPEHEVWGASGAARLVMAKGIPVITSLIHHFSDLPTIKADSPEQIAEELDKLFNSSKAKTDQINKQFQYINENSWKNIAQQYIKIFEM